MLEQALINIIAAIVVAFGFTVYVIPSLIKIADIKNLFDTENGRKSHTGTVPNLGGIAIFGAFIISFCLFGNFAEKEIKFILAALCFVFMIGAKDDIVELTPYKKFAGQIIAAFIVVYLGEVRLTSFYGILGITDLPESISIVFSMTTVVFIINAFNLIDGVNWLAGGVSLVISFTFGLWFYIHGYMDYAVMSACIFGSIIAFLKYNYTPAKIFMGDSGSLSLGLLAAVLSIVFIEESGKIVYSSAGLPFHVRSAPALAISVLIIPIFDTLRVFTIRIFNKKSPFSADRNHHHHRLLDLGFTHVQTSAILVTANAVFIFITFQLQNLRSAILIPLIFVAATVVSVLLFWTKQPMASGVRKTEEEAIVESQLEVEKL